MVCNLACGKCFRCSEGNCDASFHISCGIFAGFDYQIDRYNKQKILMHCVNHCFVREKVNYILFMLINTTVVTL